LTVAILLKALLSKIAHLSKYNMQTLKYPVSRNAYKPFSYYSNWVYLL